MAENIITVTEANFDQEILRSSLPVLVDFWAPWCAPCHMVVPHLEAVAKQYAGRLKVAKLNVDESLVISSRYNIRGIPTLLLFRDGVVRGQLVGAVPKEEIKKLVDAQFS